MSRDENDRINAIPTEFRGVQFRSLLEARFAILWDLLGIKWHYEPLELDAYIPDFLLEAEIWSPRLQTRGPMLVEVRPHLTPDQYRPSIDKIARSGWRGPAMVCGPFVRVESTPYGIEQYIGYGHPSVAVSHADPGSDEWFRIGHMQDGEAAGKFTFGGQTDLETLWREAGTRSQWQPRR